MLQASDIIDAHLITDIIAVGTLVVTVAISFTKLSTVTQTLSKIVEDHEERLRDHEKAIAYWDGQDRRTGPEERRS